MNNENKTTNKIPVYFVGEDKVGKPNKLGDEKFQEALKEFAIKNDLVGKHGVTSDKILDY